MPTNVGIYVQDEIQFGGRASAMLGPVRPHHLRLTDLIAGDGDASDRRVFERLSPKIGVVTRISDELRVYANASTGFEVPTLGEVRLPAGFNTEVKPQRAISVEGGARGERGAFGCDVSLYHMRVFDEILPETIHNVTVF